MCISLMLVDFLAVSVFESMVWEVSAVSAIHERLSLRYHRDPE